MQLYFKPEAYTSVADVVRAQLESAQPRNDVEREAKEMAVRLLKLADQESLGGNGNAATDLLRDAILLKTILGRGPLLMQAHSVFAALSGQDFVYRGKDSVYAPINERRRESALVETIVYLGGDQERTAVFRGWDSSPNFQAMLDRSAALLKKLAEDEAKRKAKGAEDDDAADPMAGVRN